MSSRRISRPYRRPIGRVAEVDIASGRLVVTTDDGADCLVVFDEKTAFLRIAPEATDLANAAPIPASHVSVGERILVRGTLAPDHGKVAARSVFVKAQLAREIPR